MTVTFWVTAFQLRLEVRMNAFFRPVFWYPRSMSMPL
ncbi:hypothetical protein OV450_0833 [Actinobacteria bacterium OV450]|nr:hypothetical protein OV450_0833 [Actinobacteria bacterium OV450]